MSVSRMLEEKDSLHQDFCDETGKMQKQERVLDEQEILNADLEKQINFFDSRSKERKREKEEALKKVLDLEQQLDAKQKLEMEVEDLNGKLQVMKHLGDEDNAAAQEKIKEMNKELEKKMEEMDDVENLNQTLMVKEHQSNDELQEARKELIKGLQDMLSGRTNIGVKGMGEMKSKNGLEISLMKREKEAALKKVLDLEQQLDAKQKLEMEVEDLNGKLQVMKHLGDEDDAAVQEKIKGMNKELEKKMEEIDDVENLNQTLMVKERQSTDELQEARKELIKGLQDMLSGRTNIGVKGMGEMKSKNGLEISLMKREKEAALKKVLDLEQQLDAKQKLEMEVEDLNGKLQVMKHLGDEDDAAVQEKIKGMNKELEKKMEEIDDVENLNQTLMVKERQSNDELQEARKELIKGLQDMLSGRTNIGVKGMGEMKSKNGLEISLMKREKEAALKKVLDLEQQLDAKQKLEMEVEDLNGKLQVMKHLGDEDDAAVQEKIKEMNKELEKKMEEMDDVENLNQTLMVKERQSNDELQEARKELIKGLQDMLSGRTNIGVKGMGEMKSKNGLEISLIKREKEAALKKVLDLEQQLDAKQKLEMEVEDLNGKLQVMKHLGDEDDAAVQEKIKEMNKELEKKMDEMDDVENLNQTLMVKERQSNDELQEARKELIKGLQDMLSGRTNIGVKGMGEIKSKNGLEISLMKSVKEAKKMKLYLILSWVFFVFIFYIYNI